MFIATAYLPPLSICAYFLSTITCAYFAPFHPHAVALLTMISYFLPLFVPQEYYLWRAYCGISVNFYAFRIMEMVWYILRSRSSQNNPKLYHGDLKLLGIYPDRPLRRLLHPFIYFDIRHCCTCSYDAVNVRHALLHEFIIIVPKYAGCLLLINLFVQILREPMLMEHQRMFHLIRYLSGTFLAYTFLNALDFSIKIFLLLVGLHIPLTHSIQKVPAFSCSIREWWSDRWNKVIQRRILKRLFFKPLILSWKVGSVSASALTFLISGIWHAYPILLSFGSLGTFFGKPYDLNVNGSNDDEPKRGAFLGFMMFSFFLVQCIGVFVEKYILLIDQWSSKMVKQIWTCLWMASTVPLVLEPVLQLCGL